MRIFFQELRDRRIFRVAIGYAIVASGLIQVIGTVLPIFHVQDWVQQTFVVLVALGFPVKVLDRLAEEVAPGDVKFKYRIVPKASYARRKMSRRLSAPQSVVVTRIASVWAQAVRIWKSEPIGASGISNSRFSPEK